MAVCGLRAGGAIRKNMLFYEGNKISCGIKLDFKRILGKQVKQKGKRSYSFGWEGTGHAGR